MKKYLLLLLLLSCTSSSLVVAAEAESEQKDDDKVWRIKGFSNSYARFSDAFFAVMKGHSKTMTSNSLDIDSKNEMEISNKALNKTVWCRGGLYTVRRQDDLLDIPGLDTEISESNFSDWANRSLSNVRLWDESNSCWVYLFNQTRAIAAIVKNVSNLSKIPNPLFNKSDEDEAFLFRGELVDSKGLSLIDGGQDEGGG